MSFSSNRSRGSIPALFKYKIVFLGDQSVGKSSILNRYVNDMYDQSQNRPTIGIDFISKSIHLQEKTVRLQLWDTAGQQQFKSLALNYIRDAAIAVIVFDVTNRNSYNNIADWIQRIEANAGENMLLCLLANKIDCEQRMVSQQEGKELAKRYKLLYSEASAKTGKGVQEFFNEIATKLPGSPIDNSRIIVPPLMTEQPIVLNQRQKANKDKKKCC